MDGRFGKTAEERREARAEARMIDSVFNWKEKRDATVKELLEGEVIQDLLKAAFHRLEQLHIQKSSPLIRSFVDSACSEHSLPPLDFDTPDLRILDQLAPLYRALASPTDLDPWNATRWSGILREVDLAEREEQAENEAVMEHYVRVWRMSKKEFLRVVAWWEQHHPVDIVTTTLLRHISNDTKVVEPDLSFVYIGQSVAATAADRYHEDLGGLSSKLGHFLAALSATTPTFKIGIFEILPLRFPLDSSSVPLPASADDLSDVHHHLWKWETSLIAVGRDLSLNSAYGRPFCPRTLSKEVDDMVSASANKEMVDKVHAFRMAAKIPVGTNKGLLTHYRESRQLAATLKQTPISDTATDVAAYNASPMTNMGDGTTLGLHVAKDIPIRDAFTTSSWYGRLAGSACLNYRWATERAIGVKSNEKPIRDLKWVDLVTIHGPFVDFWAVCICHTLVVIFYDVFIKTLVLIKARILIVSSNKVATILRLGATVEQWEDTKGTDFFTRWVGKMVVVSYDDDHYSVMLVRFHCGYIAYRAELQYLLFEMNVLLALMGEILQGFAAQERLWNKEAAEKVMRETETCFETSGIRALFERKRTQLCSLQNTLLRLSQPGDTVSADDNDDEDDFVRRVEKFQLDAAKFSTIRNRTIANSLKAIGQPCSPERRQQLKLVLDDRKAHDALFRCLPEEASDPDWQEWFLTRKEGCCFVESLRGYTKMIPEEAQERAAFARERRRHNPAFTFAGYNNKVSLLDIFKSLCDVNWFDERRLWIATAHRLVKCTVCGAAGIVSSHQDLHFCKEDNKDNLLVGKQILDSDKTFESQRLLAPAQLLQSELIDMTFLWQEDHSETFVISSDLLKACLQSQTEHPDLMKFWEFQTMIKHKFESPAPDFTPAYKHYYRVVKQKRLIRGEEVLPPANGDYPVDMIVRPSNVHAALAL